MQRPSLNQVDSRKLFRVGKRADNGLAVFGSERCGRRAHFPGGVVVIACDVSEVPTDRDDLLRGVLARFDHFDDLLAVGDGIREGSLELEHRWIAIGHCLLLDNDRREQRDDVFAAEVDGLFTTACYPSLECTVDERRACSIRDGASILERAPRFGEVASVDQIGRSCSCSREFDSIRQVVRGAFSCTDSQVISLVYGESLPSEGVPGSAGQWPGRRRCGVIPVGPTCVPGFCVQECIRTIARYVVVEADIEPQLGGIACCRCECDSERCGLALCVSLGVSQDPLCGT